MRKHHLQREQPAWQLVKENKNGTRSQSPKKQIFSQKLISVKSQANLHQNFAAATTPPPQPVEDDSKPHFKVEIENRFRKSSANRDFVFPRSGRYHDQDSDDSSLASLVDIEIYDLHSQNMCSSKANRTKSPELHSNAAHSMNRSCLKADTNQSASVLHSKNESGTDLKQGGSIMSECSQTKNKYKKLLEILKNNLKDLEEKDAPLYESKVGAETSERKKESEKEARYSSTTNLKTNTSAAAGSGALLKACATTLDLTMSTKNEIKGFLGDKVSLTTKSGQQSKVSSVNDSMNLKRPGMSKVYSTALLKSVNLTKESLSPTPEYVTDRESKMGTTTLYQKAKSIVTKSQKTPKYSKQNSSSNLKTYQLNRLSDAKDAPLRQVDNLMHTTVTTTTTNPGIKEEFNYTKSGVEDCNQSKGTTFRSGQSISSLSKMSSFKQFDMVSPKGQINFSTNPKKVSKFDEDFRVTTKYYEQANLSTGTYTKDKKNEIVRSSNAFRGNESSFTASNISKESKQSLSRSKPHSTINSKRAFGNEDSDSNLSNLQENNLEIKKFGGIPSQSLKSKLSLKTTQASSSFQRKGLLGDSGFRLNYLDQSPRIYHK